MAVPSKEEFDVFIEANDSINAIELHEEALEIFQRNDSDNFDFYEESYKIITKKNEIVNSKFSRLSSTKVYKWLYAQRPFIVAKEATLKKCSAPTRENSRIKDAKSLQRAFELGLNEYINLCMKSEHYSEVYGEEYSESLPYDFKKTLNTLLHVGDRKSWHGGVAIALSAYFYGEPENSIATRSELTETLTKSALKSLAELNAHIATLSLGEKVGLNIHCASGEEFVPALNEIKRLQKLNKTIVKPIKRHDKTAKERLLIFNLWKGAPSKEGYSLGCKASAITQLLYLEGINNSIEQRAIERLIQGWKKERGLARDYVD